MAAIKNKKKTQLVFCVYSYFMDTKITLFEPRHEISNNVVCETSKVSDQALHMHSLIRAFAGRLNIL